MAWFRVHLTEDQQRIVNEERVAHPNLRVREKMLVLWLLHCGATREKAAEVAGVSRTTVQRYVAAFRAGGLDGLRQHDDLGSHGVLGKARKHKRIAALAAADHALIVDIRGGLVVGEVERELIHHARGAIDETEQWKVHQNKGTGWNERAANELSNGTESLPQGSRTTNIAPFHSAC